jgi:hypothetical protein
VHPEGEFQPDLAPRVGTTDPARDVANPGIETWNRDLDSTGDGGGPRLTATTNRGRRSPARRHRIVEDETVPHRLANRLKGDAAHRLGGIDRCPRIARLSNTFEK